MFSRDEVLPVDFNRAVDVTPRCRLPPDFERLPARSIVVRLLADLKRPAVRRTNFAIVKPTLTEVSMPEPATVALFAWRILSVYVGCRALPGEQEV